MNDTQMTHIVHDEIRHALNHALCDIECYLKTIHTTDSERERVILYFSRIQSEFNRSLFMREYREERLEDLRKECEK